MLLFLLILTVGFVYEWKKGALGLGMIGRNRTISRDAVWFVHKIFNKWVINVFIKQDIIYITVRDLKIIQKLLLVLQKSSFFIMDQLLDMWVVDLQKKDKRYQLNYLLCSSKNNLRIVLRGILDNTETVQTVSKYIQIRRLVGTRDL
jgi:hypothetical protein